MNEIVRKSYSILNALESLSKQIPSLDIPQESYDDFQVNGQMFGFTIQNEKIKFSDNSWNGSDGFGYGIFDFVIREDGILVIGEYHTYLVGFGIEQIFV